MMDKEDPRVTDYFSELRGLEDVDTGALLAVKVTVPHWAPDSVRIEFGNHFTVVTPFTDARALLETLQRAITVAMAQRLIGALR